jgi:hypothetical protein
VEFIKKEGVEKYEASENRDISSIDFEKWQYSFCVSKPISMHIESSISFAQTTPVMFSQMNQQVVLKKLNAKSSLFKNFLKISSVAFNDEAEPIPIFLWIAEPGFKFNGEDIELDVKELPGNENTANLETFTIMTRVFLSDFEGKPLTIVGHSSCDCWGLIVNEHGSLDFEVRCTDTIFHSNFGMPLMTDTVVGVTYDGSEAKFFINGLLANKETITISLSCTGDLDIGSYNFV